MCTPVQTTIESISTALILKDPLPRDREFIFDAGSLYLCGSRYVQQRADELNDLGEPFQIYKGSAEPQVSDLTIVGQGDKTRIIYEKADQVPEGPRTEEGRHFATVVRFTQSILPRPAAPLSPTLSTVATAGSFSGLPTPQRVPFNLATSAAQMAGVSRTPSLPGILVPRNTTQAQVLAAPAAASTSAQISTMHRATGAVPRRRQHRHTPYSERLRRVYHQTLGYNTDISDNTPTFSQCYDSLRASGSSTTKAEKRKEKMEQRGGSISITLLGVTLLGVGVTW
ncbi:hypothetical protein BDN70DRAFT_110520 [Pholiota conissans]|uniref:Uncharacterized protein n=1 Tax=Pholiota conissans TaxID=109636 RepID=A0A9P6CYF2_9AGAR|nr:hypothetical protein BDN70DRAFT_110520 [Pholiota conissans]